MRVAFVINYVFGHRPNFIMKEGLSEDNAHLTNLPIQPQPQPKFCSNKKKNPSAKTVRFQPEHSSISRQSQTSILQWTPHPDPTRQAGRNIDPSGDPLLPRKRDDGIFRAASNNINGSTFNKSGFEISQDLSVTDEYGIDIMALQETKHPWTGPNRRLYDMQSKLLWPTGSKTAFSSAPWEHGDSTYQAGGTLLCTHGPHVGRIVDQGADPLGRFCWQKFLGTRGEGVVFFSGYRVCHNLEDNPGPFTQFHQERTGLRSMGIKNPIPRKQFLKDILALIDSFRAEGFRPVLMMDANEDWVARSHPREQDALLKFMRDAQLIDPFFEKFEIAPRTYVDGRHRLDYILIDPALADAVHRVGYLGNHDGNMSDHTMAYIDFDAKRLFRGLTHRPTEIHSREFMIEQADKKLKFTCIARTKFNEHKIPERVFKLVAAFAEHGATSKNLKQFMQLDKEIVNLIIAAAKKACKKKYGYTRSPALVTAGQTLVLFKAILDCKARKSELSTGCLTSAKRLEIDLSFYDTTSVHELRKLVRKKNSELKEVQKLCNEKRLEWIEELAQDRAKAAGDLDWEQKMTNMKKTIEERQVNQKLRVVTKGRHTQIDRIQIPTHDWFYSDHMKELYHYDYGVWEAYPRKSPSLYFPHHTLKVLPADVTPITVALEQDGIRIVEYLPKPTCMWKDVTTPAELERILLWRNKRHLQQVDCEGGISSSDAMRQVCSDYGLSDLNDNILAGKRIENLQTTKRC